MAGKKILMLTGEFTEEYEIFVFQQAMEAVGHTVHVSAPTKRPATRSRPRCTISRVTRPISSARPLRRHQQDLCRGEAGANTTLSIAPAAVARNTSAPTSAYRRWSHFHEAKKPIFTICHGVQILIAVDGVVRGKKVAALGACEPEVRLAGGTYIDVSRPRPMSTGPWSRPKAGPGLRPSCANA